MAGCFEGGYEPLCSIKCGEFLGELWTLYVLRKDPAPWNDNDDDNNHYTYYYDSNAEGLTRPEVTWRNGSIIHEMFRTAEYVIMLSPEMFRTLWSIFS